MKILISGHTGQVARELQLALHQHELISLGRQVFDLSRPDSPARNHSARAPGITDCP